MITEKSVGDYLCDIADAIRSIYAIPDTPSIPDLHVGLNVGTCKNCGHSVTIRQPWLSLESIVNDDYYLIHCENENCHNYYGMQLKTFEFGLADFVSFRKEYLEQDISENVDNTKIIYFQRYK